MSCQLEDKFPQIVDSFGHVPKFLRVFNTQDQFWAHFAEGIIIMGWLSPRKIPSELWISYAVPTVKMVRTGLACLLFFYYNILLVPTLRGAVVQQVALPPPIPGSMERF